MLRMGQSISHVICLQRIVRKHLKLPLSVPFVAKPNFQSGRARIYRKSWLCPNQIKHDFWVKAACASDGVRCTNFHPRWTRTENKELPKVCAQKCRIVQTPLWHFDSLTSAASKQVIRLRKRGFATPEKCKKVDRRRGRKGPSPLSPPRVSFVGRPVPP